MSERLDFKGDYMGFTYNEKHSSEFGIVRVSDGSRFNENLLPTMQDKTVQVPGGDGTYYFGSYYTQRQFSVPFAFDGLNEVELNRLKSHFGDKGIHDLIFDETPYKVWSAKVTGQATIKYLAFNEGAGKERVYKGEGTLQFTCYYPFARCYSSNINDYYTHPAYRISNTTGGYKNSDELTDEEKEEIELRINEWLAASRISEGGNFGDLDAPFTFIIEGKNEENGENEERGVSGDLSIGGKIIISWKDLPQKAIVDEDLGEPVTIRTLLDTRTGLARVQYQDGDDWYFTPSFVNNRYFTGDLNAKIPAGMKTIPDGVEFTALYF